MKQFKHIITSGCSFSDISNHYTWPLHLSNSYGISCNHIALGSQGNGLIARKAVYAVQQALQQGYKPEEILVGIMWSGPNRHDMYFKNMSSQLENNDYWMNNPTHVVDNDPGGWLIMNYHWTEKTSKLYYTYLHDFVHHKILTYEKILWVQNYFDNLGVKYFMTDYMIDMLDSEDESNPNVTWLNEMIDRTNWLPVKGMYEWCRLYWGEKDFPIIDVTQPDGTILEVQDFHPQPQMHVRFVKEIVLKYIKTRFTDYYCPEFKEYIHL